MVYAQKQCSYYQDGKRVVVNRKRATAQDKKTLSLEEWYRKRIDEAGKAEARKQLGTMTVKKSKRSYNNLNRVMPGALFCYDGKVYVLKSQKNNGTSYKGFGMGSYVPASKCTGIRKNCGLVYL